MPDPASWDLGLTNRGYAHELVKHLRHPLKSANQETGLAQTQGHCQETPQNGQLQPDRVPVYQRFIQQMLDARGDYTWNVFSVTAYDFNPYPLDDANAFGQAGVPARPRSAWRLAQPRCDEDARGAIAFERAHTLRLTHKGCR